MLMILPQGQDCRDILHAGNVNGIMEMKLSKRKIYMRKLTHQRFTYLVGRVSVGGGCEAGVTVKTRCGWFKSMEFGE